MYDSVGIMIFVIAILCACVQNERVAIYVGEEKKMAWNKYWIELGFNSRSRIRSYIATLPLSFLLPILSFPLPLPPSLPVSIATGLEKLLDTTAGKYSIGDEVSVCA